MGLETLLLEIDRSKVKKGGGELELLLPDQLLSLNPVQGGVGLHDVLDDPVHRAVTVVCRLQGLREASLPEALVAGVSVGAPVPIGVPQPVQLPAIGGGGQGGGGGGLVPGVGGAP